MHRRICLLLIPIGGERERTKAQKHLLTNASVPSDECCGSCETIPAIKRRAKTKKNENVTRKNHLIIVLLLLLASGASEIVIYLIIHGS